MKNDRSIIFIVALIMLMDLLDGSVLNTSLPQIASSFHINALYLKVVIIVYYLFFGAFLPSSSWVADKYGLKKILLIAIFFFILSSLSCGLSTNLIMLIVSRSAQGLSGAFMMPLARLLMVRRFKNNIGQALAKVAPIILLGPMLGPIIGGAITTTSHWRFIFFLNIPIGIFILFSAYRLFPTIHPIKVDKFDLKGFILIAVGLALLLISVHTLMLRQLAVYLKVTSLLFSIVLLIFYYYHCKHNKSAILPLNIFKNRTFSYFIFLSSSVRVFVMVQSFLIPLYLQTILQYNALQSGLILASMLLGAWLSKYAVTCIVKTFSSESLFSIVFIALTIIQLMVGFLMLEFNFIAFLISLFVFGFVIGIFTTTVNTGIYNTLDKKTTNQGTIINSASIQLGSSLSVIITALILMISSNKYYLVPTAILPKYSYMSVLFVGAAVTLLLFFSLRVFGNKIIAKQDCS